ncbi:pirin family protein [Corynebacterium xerosis]|uniref:Pirin family protein n=1 Tax=Corynebacterium xerosis TaxID=1725 RepID=A0A6B8TS75_9CORY|nr:pirin family protein [Corynebacterium xerosis]QGS34230.1 pirin family protein [Corynebacterium xerosis]
MATIAVLEPRDVPLGGYRAITVRRTLPHIERTSVGPFIFADHFGPAAPSMDVAPHPHTYLATCTWLFSGRVRHDDSAGHHLDVTPGDTVLMVAGAGIAHSEYSWPEGPDLHGVQLWLGYPTDERHAERGLHHFATSEVAHGGVAARVFLGELKGEVGGAGSLADGPGAGAVAEDADFGASPIPAPRRALAAELRMEPGATLTLPLGREVAILVDSGSADLAVGDDAATAGPAALAYTCGVVAEATITAGDDGATLVLLAGDPYGEDLLMFWNFVGEGESAVRAAREDWEDADARARRFGVVEGYPGFEGEPTRAQIDRIPSPPMPSVKLRPRRRK